MAFEVVKAMQGDGLEWGEGYRPLGRLALEEIIEDQMAAAVDCHLEQLGADDAADRRNGHYRRCLAATVGVPPSSPDTEPLTSPSAFRRLPGWCWRC